MRTMAEASVNELASLFARGYLRVAISREASSEQPTPCLEDRQSQTSQNSLAARPSNERQCESQHRPPGARNAR